MKKFSIALILLVFFSSFASAQEVAPFGFRPGMTVEQARENTVLFEQVDKQENITMYRVRQKEQNPSVDFINLMFCETRNLIAIRVVTVTVETASIDVAVESWMSFVKIIIAQYGTRADRVRGLEQGLSLAGLRTETQSLNALWRTNIPDALECIFVELLALRNGVYTRIHYDFKGFDDAMKESRRRRTAADSTGF